MDRIRLADGLRNLPASAREDLALRDADMKRGKTVELLRKAAGEMYDNPVVNMAIGFTPVAGDIQSGYEAVRSARKGNLGEAALNGLGVLPFIPALGGVIKKAGKVTDAVNTPKLTEFEQRHLIAQRNAALPIEQGGLGLPPNNTAMDRAMALEYDTPAFHSTPYDFNEFKPHHYRGASFFADTPEGAIRGSSAGNGEMQFMKINPDHGGQVMPVLIGGKIHGDHNYPDWFIPDVKTYGEYRGYIDGKTPFPNPPVEGLNDAQLAHLNGMRISAMKQRGSIVEGVPEAEWNKYPNVTMADGAIDTNPNFPVIKGIASSKDDFGRAPVDYKGFEGFGYDVWNPRSSITKEDYRDLINKIGFGASRVSDESGSAIAVMNPANIRSRFAAFDPMRRHEADLLGYADPRLLGAIAGGGLFGLGGYAAMNRDAQ